MRTRTILFFIVFGVVGNAGTDCASLSAANKNTLIEYVRQKYRLPKSVSLDLTSEEKRGEACYRKLEFTGKGPINTWILTLYLSPDKRYLTTELFDTRTDPVEEEARKSRALMDGLSQNRGSSIGPDKAPVTIIEFSDFECPYCRQFSQTLHEVLQEDKQDVRVVFHHMPLNIHPWARVAAEGAGCAQMQNADAFWRMHDDLFREQEKITSDNINQKLNEFASAIPFLDPKVFHQCMEDQASMGLMFRDMKLASSNQITGTPTLFINGRRLTGIKNKAELLSLIAEAKQEALSLVIR